MLVAAELPPTFARMLDDIVVSPEDWELRRIVADWCEDNGHDDWAACLRWMARERKRAAKGMGNPPCYWYNWYNWYNPHNAYSSNDFESDLPRPLWCLLGKGPDNLSSYRMDFPSRLASELAILDAWPRAIAAGWNPDVKE